MQAPDMKGLEAMVYFAMTIMVIFVPLGVWKIAEVVWYVCSHLQWVR